MMAVCRLWIMDIIISQEYVSDKIPAMLCFYPEFALHITRGVRWDSDHVLLLDDETKEMAKEIVRNQALDRVYMALDYFDASINRVSALATGFRSWQKALLMALCTPNEQLKELPGYRSACGKLMVMQEAVESASELEKSGKNIADGKVLQMMHVSDAAIEEIVEKEVFGKS